jgi:hypothetical protein
MNLLVGKVSSMTSPGAAVTAQKDASGDIALLPGNPAAISFPART